MTVDPRVASHGKPVHGTDDAYDPHGYLHPLTVYRFLFLWLPMRGLRPQATGSQNVVNGVKPLNHALQAAAKLFSYRSHEGVRFSVFGFRCSVFGVRCSVLGTRYSVLNQKIRLNTASKKLDSRSRNHSNGSSGLPINGRSTQPI